MATGGQAASTMQKPHYYGVPRHSVQFVCIKLKELFDYASTKGRIDHASCILQTSLYEMLHAAAISRTEAIVLGSKHSAAFCDRNSERLRNLSVHLQTLNPQTV